MVAYVYCYAACCMLACERAGVLDDGGHRGRRCVVGVPPPSMRAQRAAAAAISLVAQRHEHPHEQQHSFSSETVARQPPAGHPRNSAHVRIHRTLHQLGQNVLRLTQRDAQPSASPLPQGCRRVSAGSAFYSHSTPLAYYDGEQLARVGRVRSYCRVAHLMRYGGHRAHSLSNHCCPPTIFSLSSLAHELLLQERIPVI